MLRFSKEDTIENLIAAIEAWEPTDPDVDLPFVSMGKALALARLHKVQEPKATVHINIGAIPSISAQQFELQVVGGK